MCVVSMIMDHYGDKWGPYVPPQPKHPQPYPVYPPVPEPDPTDGWTRVTPTKEEFDELKRDLEEMKELLKRAKIYDEENNEPDCEAAEKVALIRRLAELVGLDSDDLLEGIDSD